MRPATMIIQIPNSFLSAGAAQHNGRGMLLFLIPLKGILIKKITNPNRNKNFQTNSNI